MTGQAERNNWAVFAISRATSAVLINYLKEDMLKLVTALTQPLPIVNLYILVSSWALGTLREDKILGPAAAVETCSLEGREHPVLSVLQILSCHLCASSSLNSMSLPTMEFRKSLQASLSSQGLYVRLRRMWLPLTHLMMVTFKRCPVDPMA